MLQALEAHESAESSGKGALMQTALRVVCVRPGVALPRSPPGPPSPERGWLGASRRHPLRTRARYACRCPHCTIGSEPMASYRLSVSAISRSAGRSATAAAAYRAAARVQDARTGEVHDYTRKSGVLHTEIVVPADAPAWAREREALWNAAEASETRRNSTVAREFVVSLPADLDADQRRALTLSLATEISARHHCAVDVALHKPGRRGDDRNFHAHLLCSTRRLRADGFQEKTRELDERKSGEVDYWRERWAKLQNERLEAHGHSARVDHRTLKNQGIQREPTHHQGPAISGILQRGERSIVADRWRQEAGVRLVLAKEAGQLEREHAQAQKGVLDLSNDLASAIRERDRLNSTRAKEDDPGRRAQDKWLEMRQNGDFEKRRDKLQILDAGKVEGAEREKTRVQYGLDNDYSL